MWISVRGGISVRSRIGVTLTFNLIRHETQNITNYNNLFSEIFTQSNDGRVNY